MKHIGQLALGLSITVAGCGGGASAPADDAGRVRAVLTDDPASKFARSDSPGAYLAHHKVIDRNYFHGRIAGGFRIAISRFGRDWVPLGPIAAVDLSLQVEGVERELHGFRDVPSGSYGYLRLTAIGAAASLEPGAVVAGDELADPVDLALGETGDLVVVVRLADPIFVAPGSSLTLSVDLNTEGWISEENVETGRIPATDIESALSFTPRLPAVDVAIPVPSRRIEAIT